MASTCQLILVLLFAIIMHKGYAWWPGYAGYPPPYYPPYPPYPGSPCGGAPCEDNTPKPPCHNPDPGPPNATCQCPAAKTCSIVLNPDHAVVDVPCGYGMQLIDDFSITVLNDTCGPQNYRFEIALINGGLVDSFGSGLMTDPFVFLDPDSNRIYVNNSMKEHLITTSFQRVAVKAYGLQNSIVSQTIFITFTFRYCSLNLTGPLGTQSICLGRPPGTDPNRQYYTYPQLTFTVHNPPPGMPLIWDLPSDLGGQGASTTLLDAMGGRINSPMVYSGSIPDGNSLIWISNYNGFSDLSSGTNPIGIYGASNNANPPNCTDYTITSSPPWMLPTGPCCQWLTFTVRPGVPSSFGFAGYALPVCYEDPSTCTVV